MPSRPIILPVKQKDVIPATPISGIPSTRDKKTNNLSVRRQRRKRKTDRRKDVRNGVIVSFSFKNDRRKRPDRRQI